MMEFNLGEVCSVFDVEIDIEPYGNGHINETYICDHMPRYILQRINTGVFKNPYEVMENIEAVTVFLKKKIGENGGDVNRETMTVIKTRDGENLYKYDENNYFRMYSFIENSKTYETVDNPIQMYHAGRAFGHFQMLLDDFPADKLHETIKRFHDTQERVKQLEDAIERNASGRLDTVKQEIDFARRYSKYAAVIFDAINKNEVPLRVTHNDTKLNNVLFDIDTNEGICVIDLDTVMPGSLLYDFGDSLRFGASTGAEDEVDLSKIRFDLERFEQFAKGFLEETGKYMTPKEIELLPISALIMTYECGIRFLADHLNGDTYFKIHRENHNLDRCRTQFKLVADIEGKLSQMTEIIKKYINIMNNTTSHEGVIA